MAEPKNETELIEFIAKKLYDAIGGGFNTNTRMARAREMAVEFISIVRKYDG